MTLDSKKLILQIIGDTIMAAFIVGFIRYFLMVKQNPIPTEGWLGFFFIITMWLLTRERKDFKLVIGKLHLEVYDKPVEITKVITDRRQNDRQN